MSEQAILAKIKQRGHWKVTIQPLEYNAELFSAPQLKEIIQNSTVSLRGWDYPHVDRETLATRTGYIESYTEFDYLIEYWRYYRSGKFIHLFGMREDGLDPAYIRERLRWYSYGDQTAEQPRGLSILATIYSLTEIFEFAMRLSRRNALPGGASIQIELFGLSNRMLYFDDFGRHLSSSYICKDGYFKKEIAFKSAENLIENGHSTAIDWFTELAHIFQWDRAPRGIFVEEQRKLLERRI